MNYCHLLALFQVVVIVVGTSEQLPIYVTQPWSGAGQFANCSVRLQVWNVVSVVGSTSVQVNYDYTVTTSNGTQTRINASDYNCIVLGFNSSDNVGPFTGQRQTLIVYGTYLDSVYQTLFELALTAAYKNSTPAWKAKPNSRIVINSTEQVYGSKGEILTLFKFWLVSGNTDAESTAVTPSETIVLAELLKYGIATANFTSTLWFREANGFSVNVTGKVLDKDMAQFQQILTTYWQNVSKDYSLSSLFQEKYFEVGGTSNNVTRLIYFLINATTQLAISRAGLTEPSVSDLQSMFGTGFHYQLLAYNVSYSLYARKHAFNLLLFERPVIDRLDSVIMDQLQKWVKTVGGFSSATVKLVVTSYEEQISYEKMASFSNIFWYIINDGMLLDGRRYGSLFWSTSQLSDMLSTISLPNGNPLTVVTDNTLFDRRVSRSECFKIAVDGLVNNYTIIEQALLTAIIQKKPYLVNASVTVVLNEEYILTASGQPTKRYTVLRYIINQPPNNSRYLDAEIFPELSLHESPISVVVLGYQIQFAHWADLENADRYSDMINIYLSEKPLNVQLAGFEANLTSLLKGTAKIAQVDELFLRLNRTKLWRVGFFLKINNVLQLPENTSLDAVSGLGWKTLKGNPFTFLKNLSLNKDLVRVDDLFTFNLTTPVSRDNVPMIEMLLSMKFQERQIFGRSVKPVKAGLVYTDELIMGDRLTSSSIYQLYIEMSQGWSVLSARKYTTLSTSVISAVFSAIRSPQLTYYQVIQTPQPNVTSLSKIFSFVLSRPIPDVLVRNVESDIQLALTLTQPSGIKVRIVRQKEVKVLTKCTCILWSLDFVTSLGDDIIEPSLLSLNPDIKNTLSTLVSPIKLDVIDIDPPHDSLIAPEFGFSLLFTDVLNKTEIDIIKTKIETYYRTVSRPSATVGVEIDSVLQEVISLQTSPDVRSLWKLWFRVSIDGSWLNGLVDKAVNVTWLNSETRQNLSADRVAVEVPARDLISVKQTLEIQMTDIVSRLHFTTISTSLTQAAISLFGDAFASLDLSVLQRNILVSQTGDVYSQLHIRVQNNGATINAQLLPSLNVRFLPQITLPLPGGVSEFVRDMTGLKLLDKRTLFKFAVSQPIFDIDLPLVAYQLLVKYRNLPAYQSPSLPVNVTILLQDEAVNETMNIFLVYYSVVANDTVVDSRVEDGITPSALWLALNKVTISGSGKNYSDILLTGNLNTSVSVNFLLKLPFLQTVANSSYGAIEGAFNASEFLVKISGQEDFVDDQGQFYSVLMCSLKYRATGRWLNALDVSPVDASITAAIGSILAPSKTSYSLADGSVVSKLKKYKMAMFIYLDKFVPRVRIPTLVTALQTVVKGDYTLLISSQDRVVTRNFNDTCYKVAVFITKGQRLIDFRQLRPLDLSALTTKLLVSFPDYNLLNDMLSGMEVLSLRHGLRLRIKGFVARTDVTQFVTALGTLWKKHLTGIDVSGGFTEEYVGEKGETVTTLYYFLSQGKVILDESVVPQPADTEISAVFTQRYVQYKKSIFRLGDAYSLLVVGQLDDDDVKGVLDVVQKKWQAPFKVKFIGKKEMFGGLGAFMTQLLYSVTYNGVLTFPDQDSPPNVNELLSDVEASVPSVKMFNASGTNFKEAIRQDYMYTLVLQGTGFARTELLDALTAGWAAQNYAGAIIKIRGIGPQVVLDGSAEKTVTVVYYTIRWGGKYLMSIDVAAPSSFGSLSVYTGKSSRIRVHSVLISGGLLSPSLVLSLKAGLKAAWIAGNAALNLDASGIVTYIYTSRKSGWQQSHFVSDGNYATKVYYYITYNGRDLSTEDGVVFPRRSDIDAKLQQHKMSACTCRSKLNTRIQLRGSVSLFPQMKTTMTTLWTKKMSQFGGVKINVNLNLGRLSLRMKRDDAGDTAVDTQVDADGLDPPEDSSPTTGEVLSSLADANIPTSDAVTICPSPNPSLYVASSNVDVTHAKQAITDAFIASNDPNNVVTVEITKVDSSLSKPGCPKSAVSYCATINSTQPIQPAFEDFSTTFQALGLTLVLENSTCPQNPSALSSGTYVAITVCVTLGLALFILATIGLLCMCQQWDLTKKANDELEQPIAATEMPTQISPAYGLPVLSQFDNYANRMQLAGRQLR